MRTKATKRTDAEILAGAPETVRAFVALAAAVERRMQATMGMKDGPAKERVLLAIKTGALVDGPGGRAWIDHAHHCTELTRHYWRGLFTWEGDQDQLDKNCAALWEREPEFVMGNVSAAVESLAHVMKGVVDELAAADAANAAAKARRAA
jgi:hypothetical protein